MTGPKRTSKPQAGSTAPDLETATTPAPKPGPKAPTPTEGVAGPAQPAVAPAQPAAAPAGPSVLDHLGAAMSGLMSGISERLSTAELLVGLGAAVIAVITFLVFGVLFNTYYPTEITLVSALGLLVVMTLQHSGRRDFGSSYRTYLLGLGGLLVVVVVYGLLIQLRVGSSFNLGHVSLWIGAALLVVGGYLFWKPRS